MQVDLSGSRFENPEMCACCGGNAETKMPVTASREEGKRVVRTKANSYAFPYCKTCVEHVDAVHTAWRTAICILSVSLLGAGYFYLFSAAPDFAIFVVVSGCAGSAIFFAGLMVRAKSLSTGECASVCCAVGYVGWDGAVQKFEIASPSYALALKVANQKKLVNVSQEDWQWLQANSFFMPPTKPESIVRCKR